MDIFTKAALVTEWAYLLWKTRDSAVEARSVFQKNAVWYADSRHFWQKWMDFELEQPTTAQTEAETGEHVKHVFYEMRSKSRLSARTKQALGLVYLNYLQQRGGKGAMKLFLAVDRDMFGYVSPCRRRVETRCGY